MGFISWIIGILVLLWLIGFILHVAGSMIHTLLVIALILFLFRLFSSYKK